MSILRKLRTKWFILTPLVVVMASVIAVVVFNRSTGEYLSKQWYDAIVAGDVDRVRSLIQHKNINPDSQLNDANEAPLCFAAEHGDEAIVKILIDAGAALDVTDGLNRTFLHIAAAYGYQSIVELALAAGADTELRDIDGATPLLVAAEYDHPEIVTKLFKAEADPLAVDDRGMTLLLHAVINNRLEVAHIAIAAGVPIDKRNIYERMDALLYASEDGFVEMVELLFANGAEIEVRDDHGFTPLMHAAEVDGNEQMVRLLIERGADVNAQSGSAGYVGTSALHLAAQSGSVETVKILIQAGADLVHDAMDQSPVDIAAFRVDEKGAEIVVLLLETFGSDE